MSCARAPHITFDPYAFGLIDLIDFKVVGNLITNNMPIIKAVSVGIFVLLFTYSYASSSKNDVDDTTIADYGVDASFPIHHGWARNGANVETSQLFGTDRIYLYNKYMDGCKEKYTLLDCKQNEEQRLNLNRNQPQSLQNYTDIGFKKARLSEELFKSLQEYWQSVMNENEKGIAGIEVESWPPGNTYTNHWDSETHMATLAKNLYAPTWREAEAHIREWIPKATAFSRSSLYGIRVYTEGSILATHVDRDPLITSAIINIAQDVDEKWPLEVYAHNGKAYNITMEPGEMILYESHTVMHGRPFPLKGRYYANLFVHFKPLFNKIQEEL